MEIQELHRGRLIDHVQLVVRDLAASQSFYNAVFDVLDVPMSGTGDDYFWADELFVSTATSEAAQGALTGRHHLAFQAKDRVTVDAFHKAALPMAARTTEHRASANTTRGTTPRSCWIQTATTSKPCFTAKPNAALHR